MLLSPTSDTPDCQQVLSPEALPGPPGQEVRLLSQEVELLTRQNEALHQRNQEMLNQLTEADREIERLKLELGGRTTDTHRFPEEPGKPGVEDLERELDSRSQELLEAQALITSLEEHLRVTEAVFGGHRDRAVRGGPAAPTVRGNHRGARDNECRAEGGTGASPGRHLEA